jgi:hypothetical protein
MLLNSCAGVDIHNEQAVLKSMQGTWTGCEQIGEMYRHIKLSVKDNQFDGWLQMSESSDQPSWTVLPGETGTITLSSVIEEPQTDKKYRRISFFISGRCCGDKSNTAKSLAELITYVDGNGLLMAGQLSMKRE